MKTRQGRIALAALAWTILGCVFALPDLSAGAGWRGALLLSLTLWWAWGLVTPNNKDEDPTHFLVVRNPSQPVAVRPQYCRSDLNRDGCPV